MAERKNSPTVVEIILTPLYHILPMWPERDSQISLHFPGNIKSSLTLQNKPTKIIEM